MSAIRAAVIGTGFIGAVHAEAIRRVGAELVGVLGSSPERGSAGAQRIGTTAFASLEELLASDVDVVHVTSPNSLHAEHAVAALQAGKHVVCEKPLATTLSDAERMARVADVAAHSGLVSAICFNVRFYPLLHEARARIAAGDIGAVHTVTGSYRQDWLLKPTDWNWRLDTDVGGATRAVADIGSHWLDLAEFAVGAPVVRVFADLQTVHATRYRPVGEVQTFGSGSTGFGAAGTRAVAISNDDAATLLLRFDGGAHGSMTVSQVAAGRKNDLRLHIDGADGSLSWLSTDPDTLHVGRRDGANEVHYRDPGGMRPEAARVSFYPAGHVEGFGETFRGLVQEVYADITTGGTGPRGTASYPTFRDGLHATRINDAIVRSAATGTWAGVKPGTRSPQQTP